MSDVVMRGGHSMRALVLSQWGGAFSLEMKPIPQPGPGEVLLRVEACGVGYTLSNIRAGRMSETPGASLPRVLGNEIVGEVVAIGHDVTGVSEGDRRIVHFYLTCGACEACRWGHEPLCRSLRGLVGVAVDGGLAEYTVVPAENVIRFPGTVAAVDACVVADAVATPWHALRRVARVGPPDRVVVVGAGGGVGVHAVMLGRLLGAAVIGVDVTEEKLAFAREYGADIVVDGRQDDVPSAIRQVTAGRGATVVLDYVANDRTLHDAFSYLAPGGVLVVQGVNPPGTEFHIEPRRFIHAEATITGARYASRKELVEVAELVGRGALAPAVTKVVPLEQAPELFELMDRGELLGRAAITFDQDA